MEKCLHQIFCPENPIRGLTIEGRGDCSECIPDKDNKNCKGYSLFTYQIFEVKEEE